MVGPWIEDPIIIVQIYGQLKTWVGRIAASTSDCKSDASGFVGSSPTRPIEPLVKWEHYGLQNLYERVRLPHGSLLYYFLPLQIFP